MKQVSGDVADLLNGYQFMVAELYTITLKNGDILCWTAGDTSIKRYIGEEDINYNPMPLERNDITWSVGVSVDECRVTLFCDDKPVFGDIPAQHFALIGGFDSARIVIELAFLFDNGGVIGIVHLFEGAVTDVVLDQSRVELTVSNDLIKLDVKIPTKLYQPTCVHTLCDAKCGVNREIFTEYCTVLAGSSEGEIIFDSQNDERFFENGKILFTAGNNLGIARTIRYHSIIDQHSVMRLTDYLPFMLQVGDSFQVTAGCDKTRTTCKNKFNNESHFLGWEYMPVPEASL